MFLITSEVVLCIFIYEWLNHFLTLELRFIYRGYYRWREDMKFMFDCQEQYEMLFLPIEHKKYIFELTCNVLFVI